MDQHPRKVNQLIGIAEQLPAQRGVHVVTPGQVQERLKPERAPVSCGVRVGGHHHIPVFS